MKNKKKMKRFKPFYYYYFLFLGVTWFFVPCWMIWFIPNVFLLFLVLYVSSSSLRWLGTGRDYVAMVTDLLGTSLDHHFQRYGKFTLKTVLMLADGMVRLSKSHHTTSLTQIFYPNSQSPLDSLSTTALNEHFLAFFFFFRTFSSDFDFY